jgi:hypothetical protein
MSRLRRRTISVAAVSGLLSAVLCLALSLSTASPARAADPVVRIDPASAEVALDGTVDVDIVVSDVTALWAASVDINFDASILEVVDADPTSAGTQLSTGTFPCPSQGPCDITKNTVDNTAGTIEYDATLVQPASPPGGSGTLATIPSAKAPAQPPSPCRAPPLGPRRPGDNLTSTAEAAEVVVRSAPQTRRNGPTPAESAHARTTNTPELDQYAPTRRPSRRNAEAYSCRSTATPGRR